MEEPLAMETAGPARAEHGDATEQLEEPRRQTEPPPPASPPPGCCSKSPDSQRGLGGGGGGQGDSRPAGAEAGPFEDCYPARREDEVRQLRRQRDQLYQMDLLRQMEEKRQMRQQRRREDIRADLLRLGRDERRDEYQRQMHAEQQAQLRAQLAHQLHREEAREDERMRQVAEARERQRELFKDRQREMLRDRQLEVEQLGDQLQMQHLSDGPCEEPASPARPDSQQEPAPTLPAPEQARPPSKPDCSPPPARSQTHLQAAEDDIATGVIDHVKLDDRRPWNHYQALQKELKRRRMERAALEAAREAAARRHAEANERARLDGEYRRYLDWRARARRAGVREDRDLSPRRAAARRWAESGRRAFLQQRAERDARLAEWRRAKDEKDRERRTAAAAAQKAAEASAAERQRRAHDSFTRWLSNVHERKLAEQAGPVGATGVTTYESFHAAPWNKLLRTRARRNSVA